MNAAMWLPTSTSGPRSSGRTRRETRAKRTSQAPCASPLSGQQIARQRPSCAVRRKTGCAPCGRPRARAASWPCAPPSLCRRRSWRKQERSTACQCVCVCGLGRDLFGRAFEDAKHVRDRHPVRIGREGLQRRDREPDVGLIRWGLGAETATCGSRRQWDHSHPSRAVLLQGIPQGAPAGRSARWP